MPFDGGQTDRVRVLVKFDYANTPTYSELGEYLARFQAEGADLDMNHYWNLCFLMPSHLKEMAMETPALDHPWIDQITYTHDT